LTSSGLSGFYTGPGSSESLNIGSPGLFEMRSLKSVLAFATLAVLGGLATHSGWLNVLSNQDIVAPFVEHNGFNGLVAVAAAGIVYTAFGAPRQTFAFACGFAMGATWGTVFSTLVTALGALACFYTARLMLRPMLTARFGSRMVAFDQAVRDQAVQKILVIRLLPVGSNLLTNLLAGSSGIGVIPFTIGSTLGYLPQMLIFALAGAGVGSADKFQLIGGTALFLVATLIGAMIYRSTRARTLTAVLTKEAAMS